MNNSIFEDFLIVFLLCAGFFGLSYFVGAILDAVLHMPYGLGFVGVALCLIGGILMTLLIKFGEYIKCNKK